MDPTGDSPAIVAAVNWLESLLLGSAATALATMAIASVGILLLTGRIDLRRGASIVLGCFMIFGAASIASGIVAAVRGTGDAAPIAAAQQPTPPNPPAPRSPTSQPNQGGYDPYAGAALTPK